MISTGDTKQSPFAPLADPAPPANPQSNGFGNNPRCLRRDLGPYLTSNYATPQIIYNLIMQNIDIGDFQTNMQAASPMSIHGTAQYVPFLNPLYLPTQISE